MMICCFKPRSRSASSFVALIPQEEIKDDESGVQISPPGFSVFFLPFSDDFRNVPEDGKFVLPDKDQINVASQVIRKLKLKGMCTLARRGCY